MDFSTLLQSSMNEAKTGNGATTYRNTENPNLDFFYIQAVEKARYFSYEMNPILSRYNLDK